MLNNISKCLAYRLHYYFHYITTILLLFTVFNCAVMLYILIRLIALFKQLLRVTKYATLPN